MSFFRKSEFKDSTEYKTCMNRIVDVHSELQMLRARFEKLETDFRSMRARINKLQFDDEDEEKDETKTIKPFSPFM
jgi:hypothetical protein